MPTDLNESATTVKKPGHYRNQCRFLEKQRERTENVQNNPGNKNSGAKNSNPKNSNVNNNNNINNHKNSKRAERKPKTVYPPPPVRDVEKQTTPQRYATLELMQPIERLPGTKKRQDKIRSQSQPIKVTILKLLKLRPKI